ncbi:MAG: sulfatase-like hydrolase/transferase [Gammaproteobacteria bacterium]|nr:sulfatase-like hydrolase/transferase [Gammaproteobacteria bacterium]MDH3464347.1 sulfatase-like hydrolase/transferase [Gammaproteobacteria bacterium]
MKTAFISCFEVSVKRPPIHTILVFLALSLLSCSRFAAASAADGEPGDLSCEGCNVLFLNLDFLRSDYTGLISDSKHTPNIDRFFKNSIIFENAFSPAGSSYRGNLAVLTATDAHIYGVDVQSFHLLKARKQLGPWKKIYTYHKTIAQVLSRHGYRTVNLNKGTRSGRGTFLDRGFDEYQQFHIRLTIEDLLPPLETHIRSTQKPFFILFHAVPTRLHRAFYPLNRDRILDKHIIYQEYSIQNRPYGYKVIRDRSASPQIQRETEHKIYMQQLKYADDTLSKPFDMLREFERNTIIVLYSNHGTQIGDKGIYASNGVSYQSSVRVPLMIKHPKVKTPMRIATTISLVDLVPTIYEMLGVFKPGHSTGQSLIPLINGEEYYKDYIVGKNDPDEYILSGKWKLIIRYHKERRLYNLKVDPLGREDLSEKRKLIARRMEYQSVMDLDESKTIVNDEWKLILTQKKNLELYDLDADPDESTNVAADYPEVTRTLEDKLIEFKHQARQRRIDIIGDTLRDGSTGQDED